LSDPVVLTPCRPPSLQEYGVFPFNVGRYPRLRSPRFTHADVTFHGLHLSRLPAAPFRDLTFFGEPEVPVVLISTPFLFSHLGAPPSGPRLTPGKTSAPQVRSHLHKGRAFCLAGSFSVVVLGPHPWIRARTLPSFHHDMTPPCLLMRFLTRPLRLVNEQTSTCDF